LYLRARIATNILSTTGAWTVKSVKAMKELRKEVERIQVEFPTDKDNFSLFKPFTPPPPPAEK
jgi:hypothetical protein